MIQGTNGTVLYTGDFRAEVGFIDSLLQNDSIAANGSFRTIDYLYIDTTFATTEFYEFPTREESIQAICNTVERFPSNFKFFLSPNMLGCEPIWKKLSQICGCLVYVSSKIYGRYSALANCDEEPNTVYTIDILKFITTDPNTRLFASWHEKLSGLDTVVHIKNTTMFWGFENDYEKTDYEIVKKHPCLPRFRTLYSMHSSLYELEQFVKWIRPKSLYPCVLTETITEKGVFELFGHFLRGDLKSVISSTNCLKRLKTEIKSDDSLKTIVFDEEESSFVEDSDLDVFPEPKKNKRELLK